MTEISERHWKKCRQADCPTLIFWARIHTSGKMCCFDVEPAADGEYVIMAWDVKYAEGFAAYEMSRFDPAEDEGRERYHSHFKTCSAPSRFSRKKGFL
jgi:hypothetical protein